MKIGERQRKPATFKPNRPMTNSLLITPTLKSHWSIPGTFAEAMGVTDTGVSQPYSDLPLSSPRLCFLHHILSRRLCHYIALN